MSHFFFVLHLDCKFKSENAQEETYGFLACKHTHKHRAEGFQRAIGKPFGRARRRETLSPCRHASHSLQSNGVQCFANVLHQQDSSRLSAST